MDFSVKFETSHRFSFEQNERVVFKITIVPERTVKAEGLHYIIVLDTSESMKGEKIDLTKKLLFQMLKSISPANFVSVISFNSLVSNMIEHSSSDTAISAIRNLKAEGDTAMYSALRYAGIVASRSSEPGYLIMLTDGYPSDLTDIRAYSEIPISPRFKFVTIGVGDDYNENILKIISDKSGGVFYHLSNIKNLNSVLQVPTNIGGKNVMISMESPSKVAFLNYPGPPLTMGVLEGVVKIFGQTIVPSNYSGKIKVNVSVNNEPLTKEVQFTPLTDINSFLSSLNTPLIDEYRYYDTLQKITEDPSKISLLQSLSEKTRRNDLREITKRVSSIINETKSLSSEVTKTIRD